MRDRWLQAFYFLGETNICAAKCRYAIHLKQIGACGRQILRSLRASIFFVWREQTMVCREQTMVWRQQTIVWWEQTMSGGDKSERWRALVCLRTKQIVLIIKPLYLKEKSFIYLRCSFADYAQPDRCTTRWQCCARARGETKSQCVSTKASDRRISIAVITNKLRHRWAGNMQGCLPALGLGASA